MGSGAELALANLTPGQHLITVTATDRDGNVGLASVNIEVLSAVDSDGDRIADLVR